MLALREGLVEADAGQTSPRAAVKRPLPADTDAPQPEEKKQTVQAAATAEQPQLVVPAATAEQPQPVVPAVLPQAQAAAAVRCLGQTDLDLPAVAKRDNGVHLAHARIEPQSREVFLSIWRCFSQSLLCFAAIALENMQRNCNGAKWRILHITHPFFALTSS